MAGAVLPPELPELLARRRPQEVAARAGNTSVSFTLDRYGHLYPKADTALRDRLDVLYVAGALGRAWRGDRAAPGGFAAQRSPGTG